MAGLLLALVLQLIVHGSMPPPRARAEDLPEAPRATALRLVSLGEPLGLAQLTTLYLQAFDNQPGISVPFKDLDYDRVEQWLGAILQLEPVGQYPLLMASHLYAQVPVPEKRRQMLDFVYRAFLDDPDRRWRWLAHAAIMAKHGLSDRATSLKYAQAIAQHARMAPSWARQMHIFVLEDLGEVEAARILLGGLLASGTITDSYEITFLTRRLDAMKGDDISSSTTK